MKREKIKNEIDEYNSHIMIKSSLTFLDFVNLKHYGIPKVTGSVIDYHSLLGLLAIGTIDGNIKIIGQKGIELLLQKFTKDTIKHLHFIIRRDLLIAIDINENFYIYSIEKRCLCIDVLNLNFNQTVVYAPNIYSKGFENNLIFFGALNGDVYIFDLIQFKFTQYTFSFKCIKKYFLDNNIKNKIIGQTERIICIRLDATDYSRLFIVYANLGLFILNLQKQKIVEYYSPFITSNISSITSFELSYDSSKIIFATSDGIVSVFKYGSKEKKYIISNTIKSNYSFLLDLFTFVENIYSIENIKHIEKPYGPFNDLIVLSISFFDLKIFKQNELEGKNKQYFIILYGINYENSLEIRIPNISNSGLIVHSILSEIKLINIDLETPNSLAKFPRKKSKTLNSEPIFMNFILALDSSNNIHFYNLENLNVVLHDMNLNPTIWKNLHTQKISNDPNNYKNLLNNNINFNNISHSFETQTINTVYGPQEITHSYFYSIFDQENKNLLNFIKHLIALNLEKDLIYINEKINIMEQLSASNIKPVFNNSNLVFSPLLGGKICDNIEDCFGMLISSSSTKVNFYVLTPHQYILIYTISSHIGLIHPLIAKTVFEEESELNKQGIRKLLFQDNDYFNYNVGVKPSVKRKIEDISFFEANVKIELLCIGDTSGNLAIYKFHKHTLNNSFDKDKIITLDQFVSSEENDLSYSGFLCYKVINFSKNRIVYIKFLHFENDIFIVVVDFLNILYIYNYEREEILYSYQIEESKNYIPKVKSYNIPSNNHFSLITNEEVHLTFYYFKNDSKIIEFKIRKILGLDSLDNFKCDAQELSIKFKLKEFETERIMIKKIICLDEYIVLNRGKELSIPNNGLVSISYEKYISVVNLKERSEVSYICFNHFIISHNINLYKNEVYISVLDCENNFILFSVFPELKICFNIKFTLPIENVIIDNFFMSLDGHMILTTKGNEFFQAWLTFSDEDQINFNSGQEFFDSFRSSQIIEKSFKYKKKSMFNSTTMESEYSNLVKIGKYMINKVNIKSKISCEVIPMKENFISEFKSNSKKLTIKTFFENEINDY